MEFNVKSFNVKKKKKTKRKRMTKEMKKHIFAFNQKWFLKNGMKFTVDDFKLKAVVDSRMITELIARNIL